LDHISADLEKLIKLDNNVILTVHYCLLFHFTQQGIESVSDNEK